MQYYLCVGLIIVVVLLMARLYLLKRAMKKTMIQMEEIERNPDANRQLKAFSTDSTLEELLKKINDMYQERQKERIKYQERETKIRREIENISHDLRTPLTSIIGYVDLINDEQTLEVERKEYIQIIKKRAKVLQGFIQDFYEISRIEVDSFPLQLEALKVQHSVSEIIVAYYNEFEKKNIQVDVALEEKQCYIIVDKIQFNRILNNLLQNVLKYAQSKFVLNQFTENGLCVIQFINEKNMMRDEDMKLIFDRFYTRDLCRANESTGLGLTISKCLVEKMKGNIEARIEGELFIIELSWEAQ